MQVKMVWRVYSGMICLCFPLMLNGRADGALLVGTYGYQLTGKGKWINMTLKKPKVEDGKRGGKKKQLAT